MKKRSRSFCLGAEDAKFRRLLGEGFQATALLLERGGAWDLVAVEPPEPEEPPAAEPEKLGFKRMLADEKREIYKKLLRCRRERGLGCFQELAEQAEGLTDADFRAAFLGELLPDSLWRRIGQVLADHQEGVE